MGEKILSLKERGDIGKDPESDGTIRILDFFRGGKPSRVAGTHAATGRGQRDESSKRRLIPFLRLIEKEMR